MQAVHDDPQPSPQPPSARPRPGAVAWLARLGLALLLMELTVRAALAVPGMGSRLESACGCDLGRELAWYQERYKGVPSADARDVTQQVRILDAVTGKEIILEAQPGPEINTGGHGKVGTAASRQNQS